MPRVLTIEESPLPPRAEKTFLDRHGFEVVVARTGRELLDKAASLDADLVVAPVVMPDMSGARLCEALRATGRGAALPVLLTGPAAERARAAKAGASAFLEAPWTQARLLAAVGAFFPIEKRGAKRTDASFMVSCTQGSESYVAFTRDISASGLFLKGATLAAPGAMLSLRFRLPGDREGNDLNFSGTVVRSEVGQGLPIRRHGLGIRFVDCPMIEKLPLARFVREHSRE